MDQGISHFRCNSSRVFVTVHAGLPTDLSALCLFETHVETGLQQQLPLLFEPVEYVKPNQ